MSGIFRSISLNNTNELTNNKRFLFSAFCTSPGTLQDVTMEHSYGLGSRSHTGNSQLQIPYRSPNSPNGQGRSVREFEEQMASLRKENFNLKLRLYFIEENLPDLKQLTPQEGQESLIKQIIDSKVEMEILRKEIIEKHEILKDAANAMNQMEVIQKEAEEKNQKIITELNEKLQTYEERERSNDGKMNVEFVSDFQVLENYNAYEKIRELDAVIKQYEDKLQNLQSQIQKLDEILANRDITIADYEKKVKELVFENADLLETLESKDKILDSAKLDIRNLQISLHGLKEDNQNLMYALQVKEVSFRNDITRVKMCEKQIKEQQETLISMQTQSLQNKLSECKIELADKSCMLQEAEEKLKNGQQVHEQACRTIQKLMLTIKTQQTEITNLKLQHSSGSLDDISNEKKISPNNVKLTEDCTNIPDNVEAFTDLCPNEKEKMENIIKQQEATIKSLKAEVKSTTSNLQHLVNKELWGKNREIERLMKIVNTNNTSPTGECAHSECEDLQKFYSDVEYKKTLEENKLLQRKVDILIERLNNEKNCDNNFTKFQNEIFEARSDAEQAEKWRRDCADVCGILTKRLEELAGFLNSLLKHKDVLSLLAADRRRAIRTAVDRSLDLSKSLNMSLNISGLSFGDQHFTELSNLSDILGDVENKTFNSHEELTSTNFIETLKAENKALKRELDKQKRNSEVKKDRRSLPLPVLDNQSESEAWSEPDRKVSLARIGLEDYSTSLAQKDIPEKLATDSESDTKNSNNRSSKLRSQERISQLEQMVIQRDDRILEIQCQLVEADNQLKKENLRIIEITHELDNLHKRNEELHTELQAIEGKNKQLEKVEEHRQRLAMEARLAEMKINSQNEEIFAIRQKFEESRKLNEEQEQEKLNKLKCDLEKLFDARLIQQQDKHKEILQKDYISRLVYEDLKNQLIALQQEYVEAQRTNDYMNERESELKQTIIDLEHSARSVKKQLDESTLQASKTIIERTKALNEKLKLEKQITELNEQLLLVESERKRLQDYSDLLANKLKTKFNNKFDTNENLNSGYTSEEVPQIMKCNNDFKSISKKGVRERVNNSSPDLGIESDAGRISSVELSTTHKPQLRTVELTKLREQDINVNENVAPSINQSIKPTQIHDCAKVDEENMQLRRKLVRTKRALEDTYHKLRIANQKKEQFEKDIKNQILKTQNVLKNVRVNMENECNPKS